MIQALFRVQDHVKVHRFNLKGQVVVDLHLKTQNYRFEQVFRIEKG